MKHQEFKTRGDKRGELIELFKGEFAQCNLLLMEKNSVWGKHYHKITREFFYLIEGEILLELSNWNQKRKVKEFINKAVLLLLLQKQFIQYKCWKTQSA